VAGDSEVTLTGALRQSAAVTTQPITA